MKKRVALLVALCIWKVVAAQTPYGEMPERFWPDTLPCRLGGGVCFGMDGLDAAIPRGGGASSCRDPRVVFVAGDTLITFISVAGVANTRARGPCLPVLRQERGARRFPDAQNDGRTDGRGRQRFSGRSGFCGVAGSRDRKSEVSLGIVCRRRFRLRGPPVARSLVGGKEDPLLGSDMRRRYVRLPTEVSVELKAGRDAAFRARRLPAAGPLTGYFPAITNSISLNRYSRSVPSACRSSNSPVGRTPCSIEASVGVPSG